MLGALGAASAASFRAGTAADAKRSRLPPLPRAAVAVALDLDFDFDLDLDPRGASVAAAAADQTRRAQHMAGRRFPRRQDAPSEHPAGSANPAPSAGRKGGGCVLFARVLCPSKGRWRAPA